MEKKNKRTTKLKKGRKMNILGIVISFLREEE